jgi:hypothetical protein
VRSFRTFAALDTFCTARSIASVSSVVSSSWAVEDSLPFKLPSLFGVVYALVVDLHRLVAEAAEQRLAGVVQRIGEAGQGAVEQGEIRVRPVAFFEVFAAEQRVDLAVFLKPRRLAVAAHHRVGRAGVGRAVLHQRRDNGLGVELNLATVARPRCLVGEQRADGAIELPGAELHQPAGLFSRNP